MVSNSAFQCTILFYILMHYTVIFLPYIVYYRSQYRLNTLSPKILFSCLHFGLDSLKLYLSAKLKAAMFQSRMLEGPIVQQIWDRMIQIAFNVHVCCIKTLKVLHLGQNKREWFWTTLYSRNQVRIRKRHLHRFKI